MDEFQDPGEYISELTVKVKDKLDAGLSRRSVWQSLSATTDVRFHKLLIREVTYGLSDQQMTAINGLNNVLQALFALIIIFTFFTSVIYYSSNPFTWLSALFSFIYLMISYSLSKAILLKRGYVYRILIHIGILLTVMKAIGLIQGVDMLFNSIFTGMGVLFTIVAIIAFKKLFPKYKLFGDNSPKENKEILDE
jgi:hypothetical protein